MKCQKLTFEADCLHENLDFSNCEVMVSRGDLLLQCDVSATYWPGASKVNDEVHAVCPGFLAAKCVCLNKKRE